MEHPVTLHEAEFKRINARLTTLEEKSEGVVRDITSHEKSLAFMNQRLEQREGQTEAIIKLGVSVEHMVIEMTKMASDMKEALKILNEHDNRIDNLEDDDEGYSAQFKQLHSEIKEIKVALQEVTNLPGKIVLKYLGIGSGAVVAAIFLYLVSLFTQGLIGK